MKRLLARIPIAATLLAATLLLASCARPSTLGQSPTPNVSGRWDFHIDLGGRTTPGEFWLWRRGHVYTGTLTPRGTNTLPIRELVQRGLRVDLTVDTPDGPVTVVGTVQPDGASLEGTVTYHQGQRYPMTAKRRPTAE